MREYFCTKFCPFVYTKTALKCAALCCIYFLYAKLTETQTSGTNFATVQKVDVIKVSLIERPVATYHLCCDVNGTSLFCLINVNQRFNILINNS